jgi:hypothetical protein
MTPARIRSISSAVPTGAEATPISPRVVAQNVHRGRKPRDHVHVAVRLRTWVNRLTVGVGLIAIGLVLFGLSGSVNGDAVALQIARPCERSETPAGGCYRWLSGRITAIGISHIESDFGPGWSEVRLTLDFPHEPRTVRVNGAYLPLRRPRVGDLVEAKVWRDQITGIKFGGVTIGATTQPAFKLVYIWYLAGLMCLVGLCLLLGHVIDRRAGYA